MRLQGCRRVITVYLVMSLSMPLTPLYAGMVPNGEFLDAHSGAIPSHGLDDTLSSAALRDRLLALGVSADLIDQRLLSLTAEERAFLQKRIDELPAGGDVLGLLVFLFLVFVITDALGATDIFPFVHPIGSSKKK